MAASPTRTLPARVPDGWWREHPRYRSYVLFAATGFVLIGVNLLLLAGVAALSTSVAAWQGYLEVLASLPGLVVVAALLVGTWFFALRWLRVGAKIPAVRIGPLPAPSMGLILIGHYAGFVSLTLLILLLLSGVVI
jgi:fumarate reductase subunit C